MKLPEEIFANKSEAEGLELKELLQEKPEYNPQQEVDKLLESDPRLRPYPEVTTKSDNSSDSNKQKRWKKENDRNMFPILKSLWAASGVPIEDFIIKKKQSVHNIPRQLESILEELRDHFGWRQKTPFLWKRISKILSKGDYFEFRDRRILRRELKLYEEGEVTLEEIVERSFPEKNVSNVKAYYQKHYRRYPDLDSN